jgi:dihydrofolate reductase
MDLQVLPHISIIAAVGRNNAIGKDNRLLWRLSDDLKRFKKLTTGHTILMGRNTYYSLPNGALPDRRHVVISNIPREICPGCDMAHSIEEAIELVKDEQECFVIGGGMIYEQFLPMAGRLYLTHVDEEFEADTFFPEIDFSQWREVHSEYVPASEKNEYSHTYKEYERRSDTGASNEDPIIK